MVSFAEYLKEPGTAGLLGNLGLGLLSAAQGGRPKGTDRFGIIQQGLNQGIAAQRSAQQQQLAQQAAQREQQKFQQQQDFQRRLQQATQPSLGGPVGQSTVQPGGGGTGAVTTQPLAQPSPGLLSGMDPQQQQLFNLYAETDPGGALGLLMKQPQARRTLEDVTGRQRFTDSGEPVFPDVEAPPPKRDLRSVAGVGLVDVTDPTKPPQTLVKSRFKPTKLTTREQDIASLKERGYSDADARDLAAGRVVDSTDQFGRPITINVTTGERKLTSTEGEAVPGGVPIPADTQAELASRLVDINRIGAMMDALPTDVAGASGPYSNLGAALDAVVGGLLSPLDVGSFFPENAANRESLKRINQFAKAAFVNNPRFPVAEQAIVARLLVEPEQFWVNPSTNIQKLADLRQFVTDLQARTQAEAMGQQPPPFTQRSRPSLGTADNPHPNTSNVKVGEYYTDEDGDLSQRLPE